jgi:hypothetical protein
MGMVEPVRTYPTLSPLEEEQCEGGSLVPSHTALANRIAAAWSQASGRSTLPVIQLCGDERPGKRAVAAAACAALGLGLSAMPADFIPTSPSELDALTRLWNREAALSATALLVDCDALDTADTARASAVSRLIERTAGPLIVTGRDRRPALERLTITLDVSRPSTDEQRAVWRCALGDAADRSNGQVDQLVTQFSLSAATIRATCAETSSDRVSPAAAGQPGPAYRTGGRLG